MLKRACLPLMLLLAQPVMALGPETQRTSMGFYLADQAGDMGYGLEVTTPYALNGHLACRISLGVAYRKGIPDTPPAEMTFTSYGVAKLGVVGVGGVVAGSIRLYGEGGLLVVSPKDSFSSESTRTGGYGHFGFEFLMGGKGSQRNAYYIHLGTVSASARADRQVGKPLYMSGFAITTGFRFYF